MLGGCISISKAAPRQCLLKITTNMEVNRVDSIKSHRVVSNKVDILGNSREAITKVVISKTVTMMNWRSWL